MLLQKQTKTLLRPQSPTTLKIISRCISPVSGPPSFPMTSAQKIILGGGSMLLMMAIPIFGLLSLPSWAIKHQNLGKARQEEEELAQVPVN